MRAGVLQDVCFAQEARMLGEGCVRTLVQLLEQLLFMLRLECEWTPSRSGVHLQQPLVVEIQIPLHRLEMHPVLLRGLFDSHSLTYSLNDSLP